MRTCVRIPQNPHKKPDVALGEKDKRTLRSDGYQNNQKHSKRPIKYKKTEQKHISYMKFPTASENAWKCKSNPWGDNMIPSYKMELARAGKHG